MRRPWVLAGLVLLASASCLRERQIRDDATGIPDVAGRVPPFEQLAGVRLGMSRAALEDARPQATRDAGGRLVEMLYGDTVVYRFGDGGEEPLLAVTVARNLPVSDSVAIVMWSRTVETLSRGRARDAVCAGSDAGGRAAVWFAARHAVAALVLGTRLTLVVGTDLDASLPELLAWDPAPCAQG
jgi:hypothetical protein